MYVYAHVCALLKEARIPWNGTYSYVASLKQQKQQQQQQQQQHPELFSSLQYLSTWCRLGDLFALWAVRPHTDGCPQNDLALFMLSLSPIPFTLGPEVVLSRKETIKLYIAIHI